MPDYKGVIGSCVVTQKMYAQLKWLVFQDYIFNISEFVRMAVNHLLFSISVEEIPFIEPNSQYTLKRFSIHITKIQHQQLTTILERNPAMTMVDLLRSVLYLYLNVLESHYPTIWEGMPKVVPILNKRYEKQNPSFTKKTPVSGYWE